MNIPMWVVWCKQRTEIPKYKVYVHIQLPADKSLPVYILTNVYDAYEYSCTIYCTFCTVQL